MEKEKKKKESKKKEKKKEKKKGKVGPFSEPNELDVDKQQKFIRIQRDHAERFSYNSFFFYFKNVLNSVFAIAWEGACNNLVECHED